MKTITMDYDEYREELEADLTDCIYSLINKYGRTDTVVLKDSLHKWVAAFDEKEWEEHIKKHEARQMKTKEKRIAGVHLGWCGKHFNSLPEELAST